MFLKHVDELTDEEISQICDVFNETFSKAGAGFAIHRDVKEWKERYLEIKKNGEADDVVVSFVRESGKIIATTIVTFKKVYVNGELMKFAFIDDVAVLPQHQGKGFGKKVFLNAQNYVNESDAVASVLYTEYKGKAWRIYRKSGYLDAFFSVVCFKLINKKILKRALKYPMLRFLVNFIPKKKIPKEKDAEILNENSYELFNEFGSKMNLYSPITSYRLKRTNFIIGYKGFLATGSIRTFGTMDGYTFNVGIISNIVYDNPECSRKVINTITRKLVDSGVAFIISFVVDNSLKKAFKSAGYYVYGNVERPSIFGSGVGMVKPINADEDIVNKIVSRKIYAPTEHMIGDW